MKARHLMRDAISMLMRDAIHSALSMVASKVL